MNFLRTPPCLHNERYNLITITIIPITNAYLSIKQISLSRCLLVKGGETSS